MVQPPFVRMLGSQCVVLLWRQTDTFSPVWAITPAAIGDCILSSMQRMLNMRLDKLDNSELQLSPCRGICM